MDAMVQQTDKVKEKTPLSPVRGNVLHYSNSLICLPVFESTERPSLKRSGPGGPVIQLSQKHSFKARWPSGLRRCVQVRFELVTIRSLERGLGSNPSLVIFAIPHN
ncbi:Uncharacterized protein HZ326_19323 [Fusarium oxysporum f. sp. albedinis]|nr:Uncharacterized protein HZ326_19323 [Fusarium oxysporum f. sp. albedinis]